MRPPHLFAPPVTDLVSPVPVDSSGRRGPTKPQSRGPHWRRTSPGLFVPAGVDADLVEQRIVEAAARAGPRAVVTGWAALRLHGGGYFGGLRGDGSSLPVPIAMNGARTATHEGLLALRHDVPADEVVTRHGVRCASAERALFDEMRRRRSIRAMVAAADMAFAAEITSRNRMRRYRFERRWYRDVRTVDEALGLSEEYSWSPPETEFRLVWQCDAGWARPLCNHPVVDLSGRLVAVPDLLDPVRGIVGEYAGAHHRTREQHEDDIVREAALRDIGLEYVEAVAADLRDFPRLVRRMDEAARRAAESPRPRHWRLGQRSEPDLDTRLALKARRAS